MFIVIYSSVHWTKRFIKIGHKIDSSQVELNWFATESVTENCVSILFHSFFFRSINRCEELHLIDRCHPIESRPATLPEILTKHTQEQYDILKATENQTDETNLEEISSHYDAIYIHPVRVQWPFIQSNWIHNTNTFIFGVVDIWIVKVGGWKYHWVGWSNSHE